MNNTFSPTRAAGLKQLQAFIPRMCDQHYGRKRNFDLGPDQRGNVSMLSPYLSHRLISEWEVIDAAVQAHGMEGARKFIDEVFWRTYWKGWLQHRPQVWAKYLQTLALPVSETIDKEIQRAEGGQTGIGCFDAWVSELRDLGYLHNHARMWFASIWVFTLKLPWERGADFFLRHLIDGDAASNTLSWRWVAGLHTQGKRYLASAGNIEKFTQGRFPAVAGLAQEANVSEFSAVPCQSLEFAEPKALRGRFGQLVSALDVAPLRIDPSAIVSVAGVNLQSGCELPGIDDKAGRFGLAALQSGLEQMSKEHGTGPSTVYHKLEGLMSWVSQERLDGIVMAGLPAGPGEAFTAKLREQLSLQGKSLSVFFRRWDQLCWPHCKKGFFSLRQHIPGLLNEYGIAPRD